MGPILLSCTVYCSWTNANVSNMQYDKLSLRLGGDILVIPAGDLEGHTQMYCAVYGYWSQSQYTILYYLDGMFVIFNRIRAHSHLTNLCPWYSVGEVQLLDAFPVLARLSDATEVAKYSFLVTPQVCRSHIFLVCCRCVV